MNSISRIVFQILIVSLTFTFLSFAQNFKVIESTSDHITIEFNFNGYYFVYDTLVDGRKYNVIKGDENYHQDFYKKSPIRYNYYRLSCGRDRRLKEIWGDKATH